MNNTKDGNLFPVRQPKHKLPRLSPQEAAIWRLADAYGMSPEAAAKIILRLRAQKQATALKKSQDSTLN
ncbi:MAG: hypothetical protein ICV63_11780 [Coleofasciculus sp. Co-bin14]|jgi:hypothetical protein|nr:hypothetical protein [Coleofasciculus sp. Co-bin14]